MEYTVTLISINKISEDRYLVRVHLASYRYGEDYSFYVTIKDKGNRFIASVDNTDEDGEISDIYDIQAEVEDEIDPNNYDDENEYKDDVRNTVTDIVRDIQDLVVHHHTEIELRVGSDISDVLEL
jgi:hypothetical protein